MRLIDREAASAAGLKRFFTGEPCGVGHVVERYVLSGLCVECSTIARKKHRTENPDHVREKKRAYRASRREVERQQERARRAANPESARERTRRWRETNRAQELAANRERWPQRRAGEMQKKRQRYANDPLYALTTNTRNRIGEAFRNAGYSKSSKTAAILGCTWPELKRHIERQFLKGMTWENRGTAWHVDHIRPLAGATTPDEVAALCHFTNLRPLWADDNLKKSAKRLHLV